MDLPIFKLTIDENDPETGVDFNSFVDFPAHEKNFIAFNKAQKPIVYKFNEEKRIVTGVMIAADFPIYRRDKFHGEHYVIFEAQEIEKIRKKFMLDQNNNNVNKMHDMNQTTEGAIMIDSYIIGGDKNPKAPDAFKNLDLKPGSWIASYYIKDEALWREVKSGKFKGFSVEGYFDREKIKVKNSKTNKEMKKTIWEMFKNSFSAPEKLSEDSNEKNENKFAEVTTVDGVTLMYDGELTVDTQMFVVDPENPENTLPAPENQYSFEMDGVQMIVTLNAQGMVEEIQEVTEEEMKRENDNESIKTEVVEAMRKLSEDFSTQIEQRFKNENSELTKKVEALKGENQELKKLFENLQNSDKFSNEPKKTANQPKRKTRKDYIKN